MAFTTAKRLVWISLVLLLLVGRSLAAQPDGQVADGVPTLVPPTLVPTVETGAEDILPSESGVARIQRDGRVRVGILFNAPPFGELNIRGDVSGFDADLARSMAEAWGVEVEFVQVTRQTGVDMLRSGQVDLLIAAQVHRRELDTVVEFSQTYYIGRQAMMVREDDPANTLADMAGRTIGVVMGTQAEEAVASWQRRSGYSVTVNPYLTLDQAFAALLNSQVDGVVDSRVRLNRIITQPGLVRILNEAVAPEPYAIALRRQDVNLRNLVNRTLQYLVQSGRMNQIYETHFPEAQFPSDTLPVWVGVGEEAPRPDQFAQDITYPAQYVIPRLQAGQPLRVAGVADLPDDAPESQRRLDALNRALIENIASRWGAAVEYVPDSVNNALELVASGQADIAVGVEPDWNWSDRVDFTSFYLLHGQRLMVKANSQIENFDALRGGRWVGIFASEPGVADRVNELARSVNTAVNIFTINREQDAAFVMLVDNNADVVFGDSLKLIPHVQANPNDLRLAIRCDFCDPWYSRSYVALAVPRNDIDFRLLVEYSLQELVRDGTLATLLQPVMLPNEIPAFDLWPGPSDYLGISLAS